MATLPHLRVVRPSVLDAGSSDNVFCVPKTSFCGCRFFRLYIERSGADMAALVSEGPWVGS